MRSRSCRRYTAHRIFQLAFRYMRNHEDAEEVVQDVLLKVFRKIELFRGDSALSSWIYRITFNTAMSRLRRTRSTRLAEVTELEIGTSIHEDGPGAFDPADWSQHGRRSHAAPASCASGWSPRSATCRPSTASR